jgi:Uma2 family endonuclease
VNRIDYQCRRLPEWPESDSLGIPDTGTVVACAPAFECALGVLALSDFDGRLNVGEYERIGAAGALDNERVELIDGFLVRKLRKTPQHSWSTMVLLKALERLLGPGWTWRLKQPVRIPEFNEPEPDIAIVRGNDDGYKHRHPESTDVALLVEISGFAPNLEHGVKLSAYAQAGRSVYWIVNLVDAQVEVYSGPIPVGYRSCQIFITGQTVPVVIDGREVGRIPVAEILP